MKRWFGEQEQWRRRLQRDFPRPVNATGYQHFCLIVATSKTLEHLAVMKVQPQRPARQGRPHYRIAFISDPNGNLLELLQIRPESCDLLGVKNEHRSWQCEYLATQATMSKLRLD